MLIRKKIDMQSFELAEKKFLEKKYFAHGIDHAGLF